MENKKEMRKVRNSAQHMQHKHMSHKHVPCKYIVRKPTHKHMPWKHITHKHTSYICCVGDKYTPHKLTPCKHNKHPLHRYIKQKKTHLSNTHHTQNMHHKLISTAYTIHIYIPTHIPFAPFQPELIGLKTTKSR